MRSCILSGLPMNLVQESNTLQNQHLFIKTQHNIIENFRDWLSHVVPGQEL